MGDRLYPERLNMDFNNTDENSKIQSAYEKMITESKKTNKEDIEDINETGEMGKYDIEPDGEWYEARLQLERVAKNAKVKGEVKPFDKYQGPYFLVSGIGDQIWLTEHPAFYYLETSNGVFEYTADDIKNHYSKMMKKKPKKKIKRR